MPLNPTWQVFFMKRNFGQVKRYIRGLCAQRKDMWGHSAAAAAAAAALLQSCPTLCSPPGSPIPGILQARTPEWGAISFSNAWKWKVKVKSLSRVWLFTTPWTAAHQAPLSMGFSRQEYWSGVPLPSLEDTVRRCLSESQRERKEPSLPTPWSWISWPHQLWES